ncbi:MAG TPA: c-type cytochrome [Stellaceae bacterium]
MRDHLIAFCILLSATFAPRTVCAADAQHGAQLFQACAACHNDRPDATGPSLKGVVGRRAGALDDFRYSPAMQRAGFAWTPANLKDYLRDPQGKVKGNRMPFSGMADNADVDDLVAYLATLK